ncbi:MAG: ribosomal subunit interface protein [Gammaproteobacteria bacterium]|nr:ribosomal subunit interface protein [Gammaproteobacteria bacterium]MAY03649.1 ribosomal subunit interface protein [Gammaproteobacteria bacterium]|tara:strand:- start:643 stop:1038 length:396 start_codon:yes stop_codon:yes gene_type:complete
MVSDTKVVFRGIDHSQAVADAVQKRLDKLERYSDEIQSLRVTLESPHNHHHKGKVFHVGVEAIIPNHDILVNNDQHDNHSHEDIYIAIRDAFNALERQIKSIYAKRRHQDRSRPKPLETMTVADEAASETP